MWCTDGQESTLASRRAGRRYDMPGSVIRQRTHSIIHRLQSTALWSPSVRNHWQQTYCCRLDNRITHDVTAHIYSWGLATVAVWVNNLNAIQRPYETEYALHYLTCHRRFAFKFRLADIRRKKSLRYYYHSQQHQHLHRDPKNRHLGATFIL